MILHYLIYQLRLDYMPFCDQYTMPAKETPHFLEGHPKRLLSLDDLMDIRSSNFQSLLEHHYIHRLRSQLNSLPPDDPDKGKWLLRLADALSRRFWQLDQKDDLEEAIWYYEEALSLIPQTHYHFLEAILGFCSCIYRRFQLLGHLDDLKKLLKHLYTEQSLNLEFLLAPVKAQLQSQQLSPVFSHPFNLPESKSPPIGFQTLILNYLSMLSRDPSDNTNLNVTDPVAPLPTSVSLKELSALINPDKDVDVTMLGTKSSLDFSITVSSLPLADPQMVTPSVVDDFSSLFKYLTFAKNTVEFNFIGARRNVCSE